jgi:O-acetylhomoserine (thiol)-lyase
MAENKRLGFDTKKVRAGHCPCEHNHATQVPIYQTASFELGSTDRAERMLSFEEAGFTYSRTGNPTVAALEQRVAALDGASGAVALASGMAAVTATLLGLAESGQRILASPGVYGGTFDCLKKILPRFGIGVDYAKDVADPRSFEKAIGPQTRAVYIESISNPNAVVADIEGIARAAHERGIPLVVDNTFATPYLLNPFAYGADLIVYSATKALSGHGDALAGLILESGRFDWSNGHFPQFTEKCHNLRDRNGKARSYVEALPDRPFTSRARMEYLGIFGATLGPFDAYLVLLGIETLSERVAKQVASAEKVVHYLEDNERIAWVSHPSAKNSRSAALAAKYLPRGGGSVLSFGAKGGKDRAKKIIDATELFSYQPNVGDARSLIVNCPEVTHSELNEEELELAGIKPESIRLSIGLEDPEDLIADLDQAIARAFAS